MPIKEASRWNWCKNLQKEEVEDHNWKQVTRQAQEKDVRTSAK